MKKLLFLSALMMAVLSFAQFNIHGEIKGYANQPVLIKIYENGSQRLIKRVETNNQGIFDYKIPQSYTGIITFELSSGGFQMVADNNPISFKTNLNNSARAFVYEDGINKQLEDYKTIEQLYELRDNTLMPLSNFYSTGDKFYHDILDEISRINQLELPSIENQSIRYYLDMQTELSELNTLAQTNADLAKSKSKNHLLNDDEKLENFGFLNPLISVYVTSSLGTAKSREEASSKIGSALDTLLEDVVVETPRGQNILSAIIPMLDGNGFKELSKKYVSQASVMTCEKTGELQNILEVQNNIQVGKKAPNFQLKESKYKSLYDVKSDKKLLVFWASWCPHCINEMPYVKEFYTDFKKEGGEIIAVSLDMDENKYKAATKEYEWINYTDLMKWDSPVVKEYGVMATPTMILLDKDNKILKIGSNVSEFMDSI
ncbi:redoxin domain-containing protein [Flavobacteriaceae bacterium Ap0902]|nr:redoxin domain-containing protein [Flavobacteriaceae bacterium Ap0902]